MKIKKMIFCIFMIIASVSISAQQYDPESDFNATRNSDGVSVSITGYVGGKQVVNIPPEIRGLPVTVIGIGAFEEKRLTRVTIPNSVITIGKGAFHSNSLTSITIPNNVTTIGDYAFFGNRLTSIIIPDSVTTIGDRAFSFNDGLTSINVSQNNANFRSIDGVLYNKNGTTLILWPGGKKTVSIPNSVTTIGDNAFRDNSLTSVIIPNSVITIGDYAFYGNRLTSIIIPNSVTTIGNDAFSSNSLTSVTIPNSVITIGNGAFSSNSLTSVIIPNSVITIGDYAFSGNRLTSITIGSNVTLHSNHPFPYGFCQFYNRNGRKAGTYDFQDGVGWKEW